MALAIKRLHNLPPHLSYVSTLFDVETRHWRAGRGSLTLGTVFLRASSTKQLASGKHGCMHV